MDSFAVLGVGLLLVAGWGVVVALHRRAMWRRRADELLRAGIRVHPESPLLVARAAQLVRPGNRRILARSLNRIVRDLDRPTRTSAVPLNRRGVAPHALLLRALADRLSAVDEPVAPRGVVLVEDLLGNGLGSPLYLGGRDEDVEPALLACRVALDGDGRPNRTVVALRGRDELHSVPGHRAYSGGSR